jgi:hypothetical protein
MNGEEIIGQVIKVTDETNKIVEAIHMPPEATKGINYIRIDFSFKDEKMQGHMGLVQLMFENNSYNEYIPQIPQKGSAITIVKKGFIKKDYKVDLGEINKFINLTKIK